MNTLSATTMIGDKVKNSNNEDLGKLEELMIDINSGKIAYAVLSFGGFAGMGNKLFAIPWESLRLSKPEHSFYLDVPKEKLENAPGFDKDNWPSEADDSYLTEVYDYYGYEKFW